MAAEVEVAPVVDAFQLLPAEGEAVLHVDGLLGVVRQLVGGVLAETQTRRLHAVALVPGLARGQPLLEGVRGRVAGGDEVLHLHLLELARAEDEVAGLISLRKDLPIWAMPKGTFLRLDCCTDLKLTYEPWAVSGRR